MCYSILGCPKIGRPLICPTDLLGYKIIHDNIPKAQKSSYRKKYETLQFLQCTLQFATCLCLYPTVPK